MPPPDAGIVDAGLPPVPTGSELLGGRLIRGIKWKNRMYCQDHASSVAFELHGLGGYAQAITKLCNHGVREIVLKVGEPKIFDYDMATDPSLPQDCQGLPKIRGPCHGKTTAQCVALRNQEISALVAAIRDANSTRQCGLRVFLWQRQWFSSAGSVEDYATEMAGLINGAGIANALDGIAAIENNLGTSCEVKTKALAVAAAVNAKTSGWLKNKILLFPGAGMGAFFGNFNAGDFCASGPEFFDQMAPQVGHFGFIFKFMKAQDDGGVAGRNPDWELYLSNSSTKTVAEREDFLRRESGMGVQGLLDALEAARNAGHGRLANLAFWGDSGDGTQLIPDKSFLAVHNVLVKGRANRYRHAFFNLPFVRSATNKDYPKALFVLDDANTAVENTSPSKCSSLGVYDNWARWYHESPY